MIAARVVNKLRGDFLLQPPLNAPNNSSPAAAKLIIPQACTPSANSTPNVTTKIKTNLLICGLQETL